MIRAYLFMLAGVVCSAFAFVTLPCWIAPIVALPLSLLFSIPAVCRIMR